MKENCVVPSPSHYFTAWEEMKPKPKKSTKCNCKTKDVLILIFVLVFIVLSIVGLCFLIHYCFKPTIKPAKPSDDFGNDGSGNDDSGSGTTTEPSPTGSKVMLVGGYPFSTDTSLTNQLSDDIIDIVDVEDASFACSTSPTFNPPISPNPDRMRFGGGGLVPSGDSFIPLVCGGETRQAIDVKCHKLERYVICTLFH